MAAVAQQLYDGGAPGDLAAEASWALDEVRGRRRQIAGGGGSSADVNLDVGG
jgi:hypothetical protein